ncbi:GYD domain-containing protein [Oceanibium sediminis]|uniref:GYD domain-containing protein n=1 Tax=Oceanibium sediminis TaxID=2026339 RepID=UPI000DD35821|nr:GYD domain-containing protein [Oceanibium sediminis]
MPKYMSLFRYSTASVKGMVNNPQNRRAAAEKVFGAAGGKVECMYFCFGEWDGVVITDFPSNVDGASAILAVGSTGAFSQVQTMVLMTMDEGVAAMEGAKKIVSSYQPPAG